MNYNINAGYGRLMADKIFNGTPTTGKTFLVAKAAQPNKDVLNDLFTPDTEGTPRIFGTITAALAQCVANRGDVIYVAAGYTETISAAAGMILNKAGVTILGLGEGSLRPTITYDTAVTATTTVTAANIKIKNFIYIANFADVATVFALATAPGFDSSDCEFRDTSSVLNFLSIITTTVSVSADGLKFNRNRVAMLGTTAATTPIKILGTIDRLQINDNFITKAVLNNTSCLLAHAALVVTNLDMGRNIIFTDNTDTATGAILVTTTSTTNTGMIYDNYCRSLDVTLALTVPTGTKYGTFNNMHSGDVDFSGILVPAAATN